MSVFAPGNVTRLSVLFAILMTYSITAYQRNAVWLDEAALWKNVLVQAPGKWRALYPIGLHYLHTGQYQQAIPYLSQAVDHQLFHIPIYWDLISAYRNVGDTDQVIATYQKALAALTVLDEPTAIHKYYLVRMHNELALVLYGNGDDAGAKKEAEETLAIDPSNEEARGMILRIVQSGKKHG